MTSSQYPSDRRDIYQVGTKDVENTIAAFARQGNVRFNLIACAIKWGALMLSGALLVATAILAKTIGHTTGAYFVLPLVFGIGFFGVAIYNLPTDTWSKQEGTDSVA